MKSFPSMDARIQEFPALPGFLRVLCVFAVNRFWFSKPALALTSDELPKGGLEFGQATLEFLITLGWRVFGSGSLSVGDATPTYAPIDSWCFYRWVQQCFQMNRRSDG